MSEQKKEKQNVTNNEPAKIKELRPFILLVELS